MRRFVVLGLVLFACKKDDGGGGQDGDTGSASLTATISTTNGETGDCQEGTEGCPCIEPGGLCVPDLVCLSETCVRLPGGTDGTGGGEEGGTDKTTTSADSSSADGGSGGGQPGSCVGNCGNAVDQGDGTFCFCDGVCTLNDDCCSDYAEACPGQCVYNDDCAADEVCSGANQTCVPAYFHTYDVCVVLWQDHTPTCWDVGNCEADVYYEVYYGGALVQTSTTKQDVVETSWLCPDQGVALEITDFEALTFAFYDEDLEFDNLLHSQCFPDGQFCGPVGENYLHTGGANWGDDAGADFTVHVRFVPH